QRGKPLHLGAPSRLALPSACSSIRPCVLPLAETLGVSTSQLPTSAPAAGRTVARLAIVSRPGRTPAPERARLRRSRARRGPAADARAELAAAGQEAGPETRRVGTHGVVGELDLDPADRGCAARCHEAGLQQTGMDQAVEPGDAFGIVVAGAVREGVRVALPLRRRVREWLMDGADRRTGDERQHQGGQSDAENPGHDASSAAATASQAEIKSSTSRSSTSASPSYSARLRRSCALASTRQTSGPRPSVCGSTWNTM